MAKNLRLFLYVVIVLLAATNFVLADEATKKSDADEEGYIKIFGGYSWYRMKEFNNKLRCENNKEIKGGINVGVELGTFTVDELPFIKVKLPIKLKIPIIGIEYLEAISETVHSTSGYSATVKWNLPVCGVYLSIADKQLFPNKVPYFYFRPISVGIYRLGLGNILDAKFTASDRPGSYDASDTANTAIGFATMFDLRYYLSNPTDNPKIFLSVGSGYRWLKFTSIELNPKGGFTVEPGGEPAQKTTLRESLDYSGWILRVRSGIEF